MVAVDNFLADPDGMRQYALGLEYRSDNRYFRGQRSTTRLLPGSFKTTFETLLNGRITRWEEYDANGVFQFCIGGDQIVYHSDEQTHAGVIYLTPDAPPQAGTTIVRSKSNKARTVQEALDQYNGDIANVPAIEQEMYAGKLLDPTAWEPVDVIGNVYNRLTLWDARMAHHASCYFGDSIQNGRLFWMFFFSLASGE